MKAVAIRELKNKLSAYLREVSAGEIVLVSDRGKVVVELRKPSIEYPLSVVEREKQRMVEAGELVLSQPGKIDYSPPGVRLKTFTSQQLLDQEREHS